MHPVHKIFSCAFVAVTIFMSGVMTGSGAAPAASGGMPVAQQNALVQRYCAVCHTDASMNGGLSLEHFDAARPDPGDAAMIVSKMKSNAFGAAGIPPPDKATQDALVSALSAAASGASEWTLSWRDNPRTKAPMLVASVVQGVPSTTSQGEPDLYRLTLTCGVDAHEGEMQLAWSPNVPSNGRVVSAVADGKASVTYKVEGTEKMGNGTAGISGPGSVILRAMPLPAHTLTISNVFPDQSVVFAFDRMAPDQRRMLSACFAS